MSDLRQAVSATLPVIAVTTRDPINFDDVVKFITNKLLIPWDPNIVPVGNRLYYTVCGPKTDMAIFNKAYGSMTAAESTLLVVNPPASHPAFFYAGEIPVPRAMMLKFMTQLTENEEAAALLVPPLGGCTLKEAIEFSRITLARDKSLTAEGLMVTRKDCFTGARGLFQVDPKMGYYEPADELVYWLGAEKHLFLDEKTDPRLVPRGLLFDGSPGVGKTAGAKYIASQLGLPLYRVDIGSVQEKWIGSSEANMAAAFSQLDNEEPCVALFDEVEKIFGGEAGDSGVSDRMLAQMLWWLAEHRSRVITVMTTNKRTKLPPELYRSGRIDHIFTFQGLSEEQAPTFCKHVLNTFKGHEKVKELDLKLKLKQAFGNKALTTSPPTLSHATATSVVYDLMKRALKT